MKLSALGRAAASALVAGALLLAIPATAFAQGYSGQNYGNGNAYGHQGYDNRGPGAFQGRQTQISGVVTSFDRFDLRVRTGNRDRHVRLHQGTIINPTGITLRRGMMVSITGVRDRNGTLDANRIDVRRGRGGWHR